MKLSLLNYVSNIFKNNKEDDFNPNNKDISEINEYIKENKTKIIKKYKYNIIENIDKIKLNNKCGLDNIGNTCYMNSVLQCFIIIKPIKKYFLSKNFLNDINIVNPLSTKGRLSCEFNLFLNKIYKLDYNKKKYDIINLKNLKSVIDKNSNQFLGDEQQDSQEFISFLISTLHEDVNKILKKPYVQIPNYNNEPIIEYSNWFWDLFNKRNKSIMTKHLYGQFKTTINCNNCNFISYNFEEFNQISIPLEEKFKFIYLNFGEEINYRFNIYINKNITYKEFKIKISEFWKITVLELKGYLYDNCELINSIENEDMTLKEIEEKKHSFYIVRVWNKDLLDININEKIMIRVIIQFKINDENYLIEREFMVDDNLKDLNLIIHKFLDTDNKLMPDEIFKIYYKNELIKNSDEIDPNKIYTVKILRDLENYRKMIFKFKDKNLDNYEFKLDNLLSNMGKYQSLDNDNQWNCPKCIKDNNAKIKIEIFRAPRVLIIHLNRFKINKYKSDNVYLEKNNSAVKYPLVWDLNKKILHKVEDIDYNYELFGIVVHEGALNKGHYFSFVKEWDECDWYYYNDEEVLKLDDVEKIQNKDAYILFYKWSN